MLKGIIMPNEFISLLFSLLFFLVIGKDENVRWIDYGKLFITTFFTFFLRVGPGFFITLYYLLSTKSNNRF